MTSKKIQPQWIQKYIKSSVFSLISFSWYSYGSIALIDWWPSAGIGGRSSCPGKQPMTDKHVSDLSWDGAGVGGRQSVNNLLRTSTSGSTFPLLVDYFVFVAWYIYIFAQHEPGVDHQWGGNPENSVGQECYTSGTSMENLDMLKSVCLCLFLFIMFEGRKANHQLKLSFKQVDVLRWGAALHSSQSKSIHPAESGW